jgi:hypothetical protein
MTTALRPMTLGELLDRSFFLYRKHFPLFVGIVALPHLLLLAFQLAGIAIGGLAIRPRDPAGFTVASVIWLFATMVVALAAVAASQGATVIAVSQVHLGRETSVSAAFAAIKGRILEITLIMIGVGIGIGIGFVLLVIPGIILALMWSLTIPVVVLEDKGLSDATSRSAELTKGSRGRIFLIYVLYFVLFLTISYLWQIPLGVAVGLFSRGHNLAGDLPVWVKIAAPVGQFFTQCLVGPLLTIALSLMYYDQRVRKEAFDLQLMMSALDGTQGTSAAPAAI